MSAALAMQGLRELEFDREMGKLSEADYAALREGLMTRRARRERRARTPARGNRARGRRRRRRGFRRVRSGGRRAASAAGQVRLDFGTAARGSPAATAGPRLRGRPRLRASAFVRNAAPGLRRETSAANAARRFPYRRAPRRGPSDDRAVARGARALQKLRSDAGPARREPERRGGPRRGRDRRAMAPANRPSSACSPASRRRASAPRCSSASRRARLRPRCAAASAC